MTGLLPPSSRVTGVRFSAAARMTWRPTAVEPVNSRWSKGSEANSCETSISPPTATTFSGEKRSASRRDSSSPVAGVNSEVLIITRFPAASAEVSGPMARFTGKLNGTMIPTQPFGWGTIRLPAGMNQIPTDRRRGFIHLATWRRANLTVCSVVAISAISVS